MLSVKKSKRQRSQSRLQPDSPLIHTLFATLYEIPELIIQTYDIMYTKIIIIFLINRYLIEDVPHNYIILNSQRKLNY